jgi:protein involved in polysaccharide export with SLBB domain
MRMFSPIRFYVALLLLGLASIGPADTAGRQLVASDMVQIKVVGQADLDIQVRIGTDGTIIFPYLGRIQAAGLSEDELAEQIKRGLVKAAVVKRPQVLVTTIEAGVYYLYGYVNKPGQYPLMRQLTVQQAIAAGGGISPLGSDWRIQLKRRMPDGTVMEKSASFDDEVLPNDTVVVNERLF